MKMMKVMMANMMTITRTAIMIMTFRPSLESETCGTARDVRNLADETEKDMTSYSYGKGWSVETKEL